MGTLALGKFWVFPDYSIFEFVVAMLVLYAIAAVAWRITNRFVKP